MTITVKQAKDALELAQSAYIKADIEHPTDLLVMRDAFNSARYQYWASCHDLIEQLMREDDPLTMYYKFKEATE